METLQEFNKPAAPGKSSGEIISHAFEMYKGVFFVMPFFLLGYPILLFEGSSFSEAISKSFKIAKEITVHSWVRLF